MKNIISTLIDLVLISFCVIGLIGLSQCISYDATWEFYANNLIVILTSICVYLGKRLIMYNLKYNQ